MAKDPAGHCEQGAPANREVFVIPRRTWIERYAERATEPLHLNLLALFVQVFGTFSSKVAFDLVRPRKYAFATLEAARNARDLGKRKVTIIEFGVAAGGGLLGMCALARRVAEVTGVEIKVVGFDSGVGMPPPADFRDHPDLYQAGDFPMDQEALRKKLPANARLLIGELEDTLPSFLAELNPDAPIGFAAVDVDYYSSAVKALRIFADPIPSKYLPLPILYLDDIVLPSHSRFSGELLAVKEFNEAHKYRKIDQHRFLRSQRIFKQARWIDQMFLLHVFDHPVMSTAGSRPRKMYSPVNLRS
jgi:hypothetical protein